MAIRWGNNGNYGRLYFCGSKITAVGDWIHEIKRCLLLGRKVMTNLGSIFKSRDITLPIKVHLVKAMIYPVVMYGCERYETIKEAECQRTDAFELWCWRRLLRVPWTARGHQSILKKSVLNIHWKDWCWSWNSNTLATWCEELTHWKRPWCWERLKAGREGDNRRLDGFMASLTQWTWVWVNYGSWWWTERPGMLQSMGLQRVGHNWVTELNWNLENILQNSISTYIYIHRYYLVLKHSVMPDSLWFQASLSLEFPRQEDWSKLPFLPPGDLPDLPGYLTHISSVSCIGRQILYH